MERPEVMNWKPTASIEVLRRRAQMLADVRRFFADRDVLEIETPTLSSAANTDPVLHSLSLTSDNSKKPFYLHTSPEHAMKRLLVAGSGSIFQIARVYRAGERGRFHQPEFSLLEWYRVGFDYHQLMAEVVELLQLLVPELLGPRAALKMTYADVFRCYVGIDVGSASAADLASALASHDIQFVADELDHRVLVDLLFSHVVQPQLGRDDITLVYDYPVDQASLAFVRAGSEPVAERFEVFVDGVELGNGYRELTDAIEQRHRFETDNQRRLLQGLPAMPIDEAFLAALRHGLPECSGVALGLDRLMMLLVGVDDITQVISFPID